MTLHLHVARDVSVFVSLIVIVPVKGAGDMEGGSISKFVR